MTPAPDDIIRAYDTRPALGSGPPISAVERALLAGTLLRVGPNAATLSGAWDTHHLVAHLVLRESNPIGSVQSALPSLGDPAVESRVRSAPYDFLVEQFRTGPPAFSIFRIPGSDKRANALEHFVHHEDVRRAQEDWTRRDLPTWAQNQIWTPLRFVAKGITRHAPFAVTLARTDTGEESVARKGDRPVVVRGLPSELALYVYGRARVADYELDGDPESIERMRKRR